MCTDIIIKIIQISFQLQNTKSQDGKTTLVHYLVSILEENYPDIVQFPDELHHLDKAARGMFIIVVANQIVAEPFQH